jgi:hypothetical protein
MAAGAFASFDSSVYHHAIARLESGEPLHRFWRESALNPGKAVFFAAEQKVRCTISVFGYLFHFPADRDTLILILLLSG